LRGGGGGKKREEKFLNFFIKKKKKKKGKGQPAFSIWFWRKGGDVADRKRVLSARRGRGKKEGGGMLPTFERKKSKQNSRGEEGKGKGKLSLSEKKGKGGLQLLLIPTEGG